MEPKSITNLPDIGPQSILFPYDEQEHRFRCSFYEEGMTYNQVSKKDISTFFSGLNKSFIEVSEPKSLPSPVFYAILGSILGITLGCFLVIYGRYTTASLLCYIGIILIVGGLFFGFRTASRFMEGQQELINHTKGLISGHIDKSSNQYKAKNLMWKVPPNHYDWVELTVVNQEVTKTRFSEKETALSLSDSVLKRYDTLAMDMTPHNSKPLLSFI